MLMNNFYFSLRHTEVVKVDDETHPLPPDNGPFDEFKVADYHCPEEWSKDGVFVPVKEGQPLWIDFRTSVNGQNQSVNWDCAVLCSVQKVNPVTGKQIDMEAGLSKDPLQNYLRLPEQIWLDGFSHEGKVYQFVIAKAGIGMAVNEFVLPQFEQDSHCIAFTFFKAKSPKRLPQTRIPLNDNPGEKWFSPLHTPQNWKTTDGKKYTYKKGLIGGQSISGTGDYVDGRFDKTSYCLSPASEIEQLDTAKVLRSLEPAAAASVDDIEINAVDCQDLIEPFVEPGIPDEHDYLCLGSQEAFQDTDKASMGAGGRIDLPIVPDNNSVDYYEEKTSGVLKIYLALPEMFEKIMKAGKRQDAHKKDKFVHSGKIGDIQVPLTSGKTD